MAAGKGQGRSSAMLVLLGAVAVLLLSCTGTTADTFIVGDSAQWRVPDSNQIGFYTTTWPAEYTFKVGDVLQFIYPAAAHNVQPMPVDSCNASLAIKPLLDDGMTNITLTKPGKKFYICTVDKHCDLGMKLIINVVDSLSPAATPAAVSMDSAAPPRLAAFIGSIAAAVLSAAPFFL